MGRMKQAKRIRRKLNKRIKMIMYTRTKYSILLIIPLILLICLPSVSIAESDSLDAMLKIIEEKEKQAKPLEEARRKEQARQLEEARRKEKEEKERKRLTAKDKLKIELARKEVVREDIRKYKKIVSSEYGKYMKEAAWDNLVKRYPEARNLIIGDIAGFERVSELISLRSSYQVLSVSQVQSISNIFIRIKTDVGFYGHSTINHSYNSLSINGDEAVIDYVTGLMWHQSTSGNVMSWGKTKDWIKKLNKRGYAGYKDWRIPTVEEAVSLLESSEMNGNLYIDPIFDNKQKWIWTGDGDSSNGMWCVSFMDGRVSRALVIDVNYVCPVRAMEGSSINNILLEK